jgi:hypothetical protein
MANKPRKNHAGMREMTHLTQQGCRSNTGRGGNARPLEEAMKRTIMLGLVLAGITVLGSGCSSSTPPPRDYHEYSSIHAGQPGSGDAIGMSMYSNYGKVANGRPMTPRQSDVASVPQE